MDFYGVIYKTTNTINGKWYIGKNKGNNENYLGSGKILNKSIKKYGKENFSKEILAYAHSREELNHLEKKYIAESNAITDPNSYN